MVQRTYSLEQTSQERKQMILPTAYLAPISWYSLFLHNDCQIEVMESYEKQTMRNRCVIVDANGTQQLSVPVKKSEHKQLTRDVEISYQTNWQHIHLEALKSAYKNTPFYDYYIDFLLPHYTRQYTYLIDLNISLHQTVMELLRQTRPLILTSDWQGCRNLNDSFEDNVQPYYQIFADKNGFKNNLSIVDLLFNMGNEAILYL